MRKEFWRIMMTTQGGMKQSRRGFLQAREFDYGTPIFGKVLTAAEVRQVLGLKS
jgi:hypothetical protein